MVYDGHHAYLVVGDLEESFTDVRYCIESLFGCSIEGHPDVTIVREDRLGIGESRTLRDEHARAPVLASKRVFVIIAHALTPEAQNALLKTLEEPVSTALFFLIVPDDRHLVATLRSRMSRVEGAVPREEYGTSARDFLGRAPHARMQFIADLVVGYDEPETKQEVRKRFHRFTDALERELHAILHAKHDTVTQVAVREALAEVLLVRGYCDDPAAALRLLGEHLALAVPVVRG